MARRTAATGEAWAELTRMRRPISFTKRTGSYTICSTNSPTESWHSKSISKNTESVGPSDAWQTHAGGNRWEGGDRIEVKVAAAGAALGVPLGHKDDSWSFPHFDTIRVSMADVPRPTRSWS